jgi:DNA-binding winged helix-turn-helix (wHTH) protein
VPSQTTPSILQFGSFELDRRNFELRRDVQTVKLDRTPLELLFFLVENAGVLMTREEAVEHVWGKGVFIEAETSLYTAVRKIRRALGDDTEDPKFIQTVSGKGYRFIAKVEATDPFTASPVSPAPASALRRSQSWILLVSVACVLIVVASLAWFGVRSAQPSRAMLIVLPLENLSGDPQQDY